MNKQLTILLLCFLSFSMSFGQSSNPTGISENEGITWGDNYITPEHYFGFNLIEEDFINSLPSASKSNDFSVITLPLGDGTMDQFVVQSYEIMEEELAKKFQGIRAYKGHHQLKQEQKIYFSISDKGIDALIETDQGLNLIHRVSDDNSTQYASYWIQDSPSFTSAAESFTCDVHHGDDEIHHFHSEKSSRNKAAEEYDLLRYRVAIATTGEFSNKYGGTVSSVMSEVVSILNKVNLVMQRDVGLELQLINNTEEVFFFTASTDPYTNGNTGAMLGQNGPVLRNRLGAGNYDIGHVFGTNAGGLASLGSVCQNNKENGVSCQFGNYNNVNFFIIVAHEMGHQFTATHTFNNCEGNETPGTAFEPGSGNTIMSYSGAGCALWNQNINDAYFHVNSIQRIRNFTRDQGPAAECPVKVPTDNACPELNIPYESGFYIPVKTPFELEGEATDANGDNMSYTWDQYDLGDPVPPGALPSGDAPHFKFNPPISEPFRSFPSLQNILSGNFSDRLDYLPDSTRLMTFRFTARDNNLEAGATSWEEFSFYVTAESGPFQVMKPNLGEPLLAGVHNFINWDPANSQNAPVNCPSVDIMISTDGGRNFNDTLVAGTPNDGRALVLIPQDLLGESNVRIKIKCSESIFFDLSNRNSSVIEATEPGYVGIIEPEYQEICLPEKANILIETKSILNYDSTVFVRYNLSFTDGVQVDLPATEIQAGENLDFSIDMDESTAGDTLVVGVTLFNVKDTFEYTSRILAISNNFSDQRLLSPVDGVNGGSLVPDFEWTRSADAKSYQLQIATNASFDNSFIVYEETLNGTSVEKPITLEGTTIYYWRVNCINQCGTFVTGNVNVYATEVLSCREYSYNGGTIRISPNGTPEVSMNLTVVESGPVNDLNVLNVSASHEFVGDLSAKIVSPAGTEVKLWSNTCANRTTVNASFDDEATEEFDCLFLSTPGPAIEPEEPLSAFNGEEQFGNWSLVINDDTGGAGGELESFAVEVCAASFPETPSKLINEVLSMDPATQETITSDLLAYGHPDIDDRDIIFALTKPTSKGVLRSGSRVIGIGQGFRMSDILNGNLTYEHQSGETDEWDSFDFIVFNTAGTLAGPIDVFRIRIGEPVNSAEEVQHNLRVYPNPNQTKLAYVDLPYSGDWNIEMMSIDGKQIPIDYQVYGITAKINWSSASAGIHVVRIFNERDNITSKLFISK